KEEVKVKKKHDILIVEINYAHQLQKNQQANMNEFFDFSIYIDADPLHIQTRFMDRFKMHMESAKDDPTNYFYEITKWPSEKVEDYGNEIWYTINLTNLVQHIQPTRGRADVILYKGKNHSIDNVYVRKY